MTSLNCTEGASCRDRAPVLTHAQWDGRLEYGLLWNYLSSAVSALHLIAVNAFLFSEKPSKRALMADPVQPLVDTPEGGDARNNGEGGNTHKSGEGGSTRNNGA